MEPLKIKILITRVVPLLRDTKTRGQRGEFRDRGRIRAKSLLYKMERQKNVLISKCLSFPEPRRCMHTVGLSEYLMNE